MAFSAVKASLLLTATMLLVGSCASQRCPLPERNTVESLLRSVLLSEGGESRELTISLIDFHFTCLAVVARDVYRSFSVAVSYNRSDSSTVNFAQLQLTCLSPTNIQPSASIPFERNVNPSIFNITTRRDCRFCTATTGIEGIDTNANCFLCPDGCRSMGQGACSRDGTACCSFFTTDGTCTTDCPEDFAATPMTNYTCVCNQTCLNGGVLNGTSCSCNCPRRFTGERCETVIDECIPNPCTRGMCRSTFPGFECDCPPGFTGPLCETDIDDCIPNPCQNGGTCFDRVNTFTCQCPPGFGGRFCEIDIDNCRSMPCASGATCIDGNNSFTCECPPGFTGRLCETDIDDCIPNPCLNGGSCTDGVDSFTCECPPGFTGRLCDTDIDNCMPNPCLNGGNCTDGVDSFTCTCPSGYTGSRCEIDIDDCTPNPCQNSGTCIDRVNGFECMCPVGYTGMTCEACALGYLMESGRCVPDCNTSCQGLSSTFAFDICRFECLVRIWRGQAEDCGVDLPDMTTTIDKTQPETVQWDMAVALWTELRNAWSEEAVTRGVKVTSPTPDQDNSQPRIDQWESSLEQWRMDQNTWQTAATQLSSGFPQLDLSPLNFNFTGTTQDQRSTFYTTVAELWITASDSYESDLAGQCPA